MTDNEASREKFIKYHSPYVVYEGTYYFITGAIISQSGELIPPPRDEYELYENLTTFWEVESPGSEKALQMQRELKDARDRWRREYEPDEKEIARAKHRKGYFNNGANTRT